VAKLCCLVLSGLQSARGQCGQSTIEAMFKRAALLEVSLVHIMVFLSAAIDSANITHLRASSSGRLHVAAMVQPA